MSATKSNTPRKSSSKVPIEKLQENEGAENGSMEGRWILEPFTKEQSSGPFLEESSFATLFPAYREKYLREVWRIVTRELSNHGIGCELNLVEGSMTVKTTRKTWDPFAIINAKDFIKLLARSVPVPQALKIFRDDMQCDIVKIGGFVYNRERFVKRRQRLIGPNGSTLKAIELLTECYILVQGNTVACMGSFKGLKQARRIIEQCMQNIHPVYNIKALMIKRELAKDPQLKNENWERFLPKFAKKNPKKKKGSIKEDRKRREKNYTPFPPQPKPSKVDLQLESGEYFMSENQRKRRRLAEKRSKREERASEKRARRELEYVPPEEPARAEQPLDQTKLKTGGSRKKIRKRITASSESAKAAEEDVFAIAAKVKQSANVTVIHNNIEK